MKILLIVNEGPWGSALGMAALRLLRALLRKGVEIAAVYFRGDGVYHALRGRAHDADTPRTPQAWLDLAGPRGIPLLLCSADSQRRLEAPAQGGFREAGLAEALELMAACDRIVSL